MSEQKTVRGVGQGGRAPPRHPHRRHLNELDRCPRFHQVKTQPKQREDMMEEEEEEEEMKMKKKKRKEKKTHHRRDPISSRLRKPSQIEATGRRPIMRQNRKRERERERVNREKPTDIFGSALSFLSYSLYDQFFFFCCPAIDPVPYL